MTSEELLHEGNDDLFHSDEIVKTIDRDNIIELEENDLNKGHEVAAVKISTKGVHVKMSTPDA